MLAKHRQKLKYLNVIQLIFEGFHLNKAVSSRKEKILTRSFKILKHQIQFQETNLLWKAAVNFFTI